MNELKIAEVEDELSNLVPNYSPEIQGVIEAQIKTLKFIQDPTLMVSITDLILQDLDMSLRHVPNEDQRTWLKEQTAITIQNFIFVMHASLIYEINENREEGVRLLKESASLISKSITSVLMKAGDKKQQAIEIGAKLLSAITEDTNKPSFWCRIVDYFNKKKKHKRKKNDFMKMVEKTLIKIGRRKRLLGKSIILSELLYNYIDHIDEHKNELIKESCYDKNSSYSGLGCLMFFITTFIIVIVVLTLFLINSTLVIKYEYYLTSIIIILPLLLTFIIPILDTLRLYITMKFSLFMLKRQLLKIAQGVDPDL